MCTHPNSEGLWAQASRLSAAPAAASPNPSSCPPMQPHNGRQSHSPRPEPDSDVRPMCSYRFPREKQGPIPFISLYPTTASCGTIHSSIPSSLQLPPYSLNPDEEEGQPSMDMWTSGQAAVGWLHYEANDFDPYLLCNRRIVTCVFKGGVISF